MDAPGGTAGALIRRSGRGPRPDRRRQDAEASGETVEVKAGEKFALQITAGAALRGEAHVRSTPEQVSK